MLKLIENSGMNFYDAQNLPMELDSAISASVIAAQGNTAFRPHNAFNNVRLSETVRQTGERKIPSTRLSHTATASSALDSTSGPALIIWASQPHILPKIRISDRSILPAFQKTHSTCIRQNGPIIRKNRWYISCLTGISMKAS